jgi:hypothetical protein
VARYSENAKFRTFIWFLFHSKYKTNFSQHYLLGTTSSHNTEIFVYSISYNGVEPYLDGNLQGGVVYPPQTIHATFGQSLHQADKLKAGDSQPSLGTISDNITNIPQRIKGARNFKNTIHNLSI